MIFLFNWVMTRFHGHFRHFQGCIAGCVVDLNNSYFHGAGVFVWWFVLKSKKRRHTTL